MIVFGNLLITISRLLDMILMVMWWLILIRALISWVNPDPYNPIVQFLYRTTEPILYQIRRFLPPMGIDISPIIAWLLIVALQSFLVTTIYEYGIRLKY